jgi:hypothetical protein
MNAFLAVSEYVRSCSAYLWNFVERGFSLSPANLFGVTALLGTILPSAAQSASDEVPGKVICPNEAQGPDFDVVARLRDFFKRFVFLPEDSLYLLLALWTLGTYLYEHFEYFGYLFIHSPEPQSGKSRLLELLQQVTHNPSEIAVDPTSAVLFRTAANSTHLMDEVDGWTNKDELRNVLNAGFKRGGVVIRMREAKGDYTPEKFKVYAPRALAGIGLSILDQTTRDRSFIVRMVRQKPTERCEQFRLKKLQEEIQGLRADLKDWVAKHKATIADFYDREEFQYQSFQLSAYQRRSPQGQGRTSATWPRHCGKSARYWERRCTGTFSPAQTFRRFQVKLG